jgi:hypothetical protein
MVILPFLFSVNTYSQNPMLIQTRQNGPLRCFADQFLKIHTSKHEVLWYCLTVLPMHQVEKRYGHWSSPHSYNVNGGERISGDTLTPMFLNVRVTRLRPVLTKKNTDAYRLATTFCPVHCTRVRTSR